MMEVRAAQVAPGDLGEAETLLAAAASRGDAVAFVGGATELGFGYPAERVDLLVDTKRLARILDYAPADMVVEVEAGITLAGLQKALAPNRQRLALDPPYPELATIGGLVATNAFGPRRTRHGSLRDLIVGISLVRADGVRVRGGGKVVKNVAGFDLPKLAVGSLGTLGLIASATFRLHPLPEAARVLRIEAASGEKLRVVAREILARQLEPAALSAFRAADRYDLYVLFEGFEAGVTEQVKLFAALANDAGLSCTSEGGAGGFEARDESARTHGTLRLRIAVPPASLAELHRDALDVLTAALDEPRIVVYPMLGIAFVAADVRDPEKVAAAVIAVRTSAEALHGNLVVLAAPPSLSAVDVYGTLPPSFGLMRRLKERFDPSRRLNRGRFLGRL